MSSINCPCSLWVSSVTSLYFLNTGAGSRTSKKGFQANAVPSPHILPPLHVRVRAEASPRSILVPPPCSPDPSCCLSSFSCDRSADMRIPHRSSSHALCTHTHRHVCMCSLGHLLVLCHSQSQHTCIQPASKLPSA